MLFLHAPWHLVYGQSTDPMREASEIPMKRSEFDKSIKAYSTRMSAAETFGVDDLLFMTRAWNTIEWQKLQNSNEDYRHFCTLYYPDFFKLAAEKTRATLSKGMAMYSKEYELWLGGAPHAHSQFKLLE
jgi:hypothetical protein